MLSTTRLFGVLAHVDAGKTTVSERLLYFSGRIHRMGEVHHGTATLDHTEEEQKHGITISAAATSLRWTAGGVAHQFSLIDTPGHIDFAIEVERSLRVLDGAVVVLDASHGVEPQTESVWRQADRHGVPRVVFLNKLDAPGASVEACLAELSERLGAVPVLLQRVEGETTVDLVTSLDDSARAALVERVADHDATLLAEWLVTPVVSAEQLRAALRRATLSRAVVPVLCGAALRNRGIEALLDAIAFYLPSPADKQPSNGLVADPARPACAFVFKTEVDAQAGTLSWVRVFQGTLRPGDTVVVGGVTQRIARLVRLHAGTHESVDALGPGGIGAVVGLKRARTGETLNAPGQQVELAPIEAAEPVVELALEARSAEEQAKLTQALRRATLEDPSLRVRVDAESGQTVLCGVGELHLSIWLEKLARRDQLKVKTGAPMVALRDTFAGEAQVTTRHVRQSGGPGQFAVVTLAVRPAERGAGFRFVDQTRGGVIPAGFVPAVEAGARGALERGLREGVPVVDVEVTLLDGQVHVRDSSAAAFEVAGSLAVQQAGAQVGLVRLEPMARVEVAVPEASLGGVLGELATRSASVESVSAGAAALVKARIPLARTFGLVTALRSRSGGRASVSLQVAGYEPA